MFGLSSRRGRVWLHQAREDELKESRWIRSDANFGVWSARLRAGVALIVYAESQRSRRAQLRGDGEGHRHDVE